jgi:hypothetical protein
MPTRFQKFRAGRLFVDADLPTSILCICSERVSDLPVGGFQSPKGNGMVGVPLLTGKGLESLRQIETCLVANAIESFNVRLRNTGFADARVRCMFEDMPPIVGYAVTARLRSGEPPIGGGRFRDRADFWNSILETPAPRHFASHGLCRLCDERGRARTAGRTWDGDAVVRRWRGRLPCLLPYIRDWDPDFRGRNGSPAERFVARRSARHLDGSG